MTDPDSALPPELEDRVRDLLAEARHDEPVPPEVVARLDRVLADLAAPTTDGATVTPLVRRRRRAAGLLVAAAAVVAVGVGISQVVPGSSGGDAMTAADEEAADRPAHAPEAQGDASGVTSEAPADALEDAPPVRLRKRHFARDVELAQSLAQSYAVADRSAAGFSLDRARRADCRAGDWGPGTVVPARYGSERAVVVLRRPTGDTQLADLFVCGREEPVRSARLPAP